MSKPAVLHVTQAVGDESQTVGGVAVVMLDQVQDLVAGGWDVTVAGPDHGRLPDDVTSRGATFARWHADREPGPSVARESRELRRVLARVDPGVIHLHSSKAGLVGRAVTRGKVPTIFSPHAWSFHHARSATMRAAVRSWERSAARWADVILCVSEAERGIGIRAGVQGRFEVLSNTVNLPAPSITRERARSLVLGGIGADTPLAVCIGRLTAQKGQDILLRAWPRVVAQVPTARLVIVGSGPDQDALRHLAPDDVVFVPAVPRDQVPTWTVAGDVMVFPSRWEGQSIGVLESLNLGRPVVVSDCAGMAEALAGGRGTMVSVGDEPALEAAVVPYLRDRAWAAEQGRLAALDYRLVHGERRRVNQQRYRELVAGLADRPS